MKGKDNGNKKIFQKAAEAAAKDIQELIVKNKPIPDVSVETALDIIDEEKNDWDELRKAIDGKYAKKFMNILKGLPDREFIRSYLKVLEYVKPKVTRSEETIDGIIDNSVTIQILQILPNGEKRVIELKDNKLEEEE